MKWRSYERRVKISVNICKCVQRAIVSLYCSVIAFTWVKDLNTSSTTGYTNDGTIMSPAIHPHPDTSDIKCIRGWSWVIWNDRCNNKIDSIGAGMVTCPGVHRNQIQSLTLKTRIRMSPRSHLFWGHCVFSMLHQILSDRFPSQLLLSESLCVYSYSTAADCSAPALVFICCGCYWTTQTSVLQQERLERLVRS